MAKKVSGLATGGSIFDIVNSVDNSAEILSESKVAVIKDYIDSGSYILNAAMTGSLFKGIPCSRCTVFAGANSTGKSFLALSACRNAQKKGYTPIYIDTEGAIDIETVKRIGCDPNNFIIKPANTVTEANTFILNTINSILAIDEEKRPKVVFVLDSISNLSSNKEKNDLEDGDNKQDMTRNKEIKALFRTCLVPLSKVGAPLICTAHIYQTLDLFSKTVVSGGTGLGFGNSLTMLLTTAKLDDKESDKIMEKKTGEFVKTGAIVTAKPEKSRFTIPQKVRFVIPYFKAPNPYVGLDAYLTWENSGIMIKSKGIDEKEYAKLSDAEKAKCQQTTDGDGKVIYAYPKDTAKTIVVAGKGELPMKSLFTKEVLTDELLHKLDDEVIRPLFELPSQSSMADIDEMIDEE